MQHFVFSTLLCVTLASSLTSSIASAQISDPCKDLHASACTGGNRNDGTGVSVDGAQIKEVLDSVRAKVAKEMAPDIALQLTNDKAYRTLVFDALGSELGLACRVALSLSHDCINTLAGRASKFMVDTHNDGFSIVGLAAKYELVASPTTKKLQLSAENRLRKYMNYEKKNAEVDQMIKEITEIMVRRVERSVADPVKRKLLVDRIREIKKNLPSHEWCSSGDLPKFMIPNAFYEHQKKTLSICPSMYLYTTSAYALSMAIAHEIAHSIGPSAYATLAAEKLKKDLGTRKEYEQAHPYAKALKCLRDVPTAGAQVLPIAPVEYTQSTVQMDAATYLEMAAVKDEINEAFADWLGSDVGSEYLEKTYPQASVQQRRLGYTNAFRLFCGKQPPNDNHRSAYRRSLTAAAMPRIRKQMGCTDNYPTAASCGAGRIEASNSDANSSGAKKQGSVK